MLSSKCIKKNENPGAQGSSGSARKLVESREKIYSKLLNQRARRFLHDCNCFGLRGVRVKL